MTNYNIISNDTTLNIDCNSTKTVLLSEYKLILEKLIWSVCLNYASEQISIGKACELLNVTSDEFRKIFETFPYEQKPVNINECIWLNSLSQTEQDLLKSQLEVMCEYSKIINKRIKLINDK